MNYEFGEMKGARRRSKRETVVKSGNQERRKRDSILYSTDLTDGIRAYPDNLSSFSSTSSHASHDVIDL